MLLLSYSSSFSCFLQFLDDLTDADVLIHVVDVSGIADAEGNIIGLIDENSNDQPRKGAGSNPLYDLSWIQNELIQWVANNVESKWDTIVRRGRNKVNKWTNFIVPASNSHNFPFLICIYKAHCDVQWL